MKKFLMAMLACLSLSFACVGFAACGGDKNDDNNSSSGPTEEVSDFTFSHGYWANEVYYEGICVNEYTGTDVNVVIPDTYDGQPVVAIGTGIFNGYYRDDSIPSNGIKIKSVSMPDTITHIQTQAFSYCKSIETITLSKGLTYIGDRAFEYCEALQKADIPDGVETIEYSAFLDCGNLEGIKIPKAIKSIGHSAFSACDKLQSIDCPEGLTTIGDRAFAGCANLMQAILPSTATLGEGVFSGCNRLVEIINKSPLYNFPPETEEVAMRVESAYTIEVMNACLRFLTEEPAQSNFIEEDGFVFYDCRTEGGVVSSFDQGKIFLVNYTGNETDVIVPTTAINDSSFVIRDYALTGTSIKHFNTSNSATALEDKAFYQSDILSLVIGENVSSMGSSSSMYYDWNYAVEVVNLSSLTWIEESYAKYQRACAQYLTAIPTTSNFFEKDGFTYYKKGTTTALVDGEFGEWGGEGSLPRTDFDYVLDMKLPWLTKLTVPSCVILEKWGYSSSCMSSIDEVVLEEGITSIPEQYFLGCTLEKISIPDSITEVGANAFKNCSSLEYYEKDGSKYLGNANNPQAVLVSISDTSATEMTIGGDIKAVAEGVFENCENLTTVYWYLDGEPSVDIFGEKLATLTFKYHNIAPTTTSYTIPTGIKTLKYKHLEGASSIKELVIPASVSKIEAGALKDLTALEKITLPATGTDYGRIFGKLFGQKTGSGIYQQMQSGAPLVEYGIPSTLTEIVVLDGKVSDYYFNGCKNITKANFDTITEIGEAAFVGTGFTAITLTDGLTELGNSAFANCTSLQTVVLPKTAEAFKLGEATTLGAMFVGCSALRELTLPDVQVISSQSFDNVSGLTVYYYNDFTILDATAQLPTFLQKEDCFSNVVFVKK